MDFITDNLPPEVVTVEGVAAWALNVLAAANAPQVSRDSTDKPYSPVSITTGTVQGGTNQGRDLYYGSFNFFVSRLVKAGVVPVWEGIEEISLDAIEGELDANFSNS